VVTFLLLSLSLLISLPVPIASRIETAFLQNSPEILRELMTPEGTIPVSLPEPLSLADQLSPDQAFLVFKRIFSVYKTTEFTAEPRLSALPGQSGGVLKARWSFRNERSGNQYPMRVYFFVVPGSAARPGRGPRGPGIALRIIEIRAERL
jgi:hypothetical protein